MAQVIEFDGHRRHADTLLCRRPLEFRLGNWPTGFALLCTRGEARRFEHRLQQQAGDSQSDPIVKVANHIRLDDGCHFTVQGLFRHRRDEDRMRRVYRLAGLMECVTSVSSPVLRTDLLRHVYRTILDERAALAVAWRGNVTHYLLPLYCQHYNRDLFFHRVRTAESLKAFYSVIADETEEQFRVLSRDYVIYVPTAFVGSSPG